MSLMFLVLMVLAAIGLSIPVGKLMIWAMNPVDNPGSFRKKLDSVFAFVGGPFVKQGQHWKRYFYSLLIFNALTFVLVYLAFVFQSHLPLNPAGIGNMEPSLAFNTASSFVGNTNLQHYSGETGLTYFTQVFAIMWLQFVSAATGIAALAAVCRCLAGRENAGNFFQDLMRATFLILLPLALISAILLVFGGVVMTFDGPVKAMTIEGAVQTIARGPVATFTAITQLGTNGGGFFGPNATHPFSNPSYFTNIIESLSLIIIPMGSVWLFGAMTGRRRHAFMVFCVMLFIYAVNMGLAAYTESKPPMALADVETVISETSNLEGKEMRFGTAGAVFWTVTTTSTSNGSVNNMHDSLNPLTGLIALTGMWLNMVFGGVGVGFLNMFIFIIIGVFICGMMVGRTPEYLNKKVETKEMKFALLALLLHPFLILCGTALFAATPWGTSTILNSGAHGFSEILYEFTSAAANNGSGFEGLGDNTIPWNISTGLSILLGRFLPIAFCMAIAGSLADKKFSPDNAGTLHTDTFLFSVVLLGCVIFIGALLFLPVAVLGPISEYLSM